MREIAWEAWKAAANAHRMYPDNKHTFGDYWDGFGKATSARLTSLSAPQDEGWVKNISQDREQC